MIVQIQQAQMSPIAAVKFLCLHQQHVVFTQRPRSELRDVRNALFLVDDQVVDGVQVFGTTLFDQSLRRVWILPSTIDVGMLIGAGELGVLSRSTRGCKR